jgi:hypothetical protein
MNHASAIAESNVAPTLFRPEFSHSLDPKRTRILTEVSAVPTVYNDYLELQFQALTRSSATRFDGGT